jgi:Sec-independent protein translocase protein TatA
LPDQLGSILGQLAGQFQELVSDANDIMREQDQYSKTRRKKQPKRPKQMNALAPSIPGIPEQMSPAAEALSRLGAAQSNSQIEKTALLGTIALGLGSAYAVRLLVSALSRKERDRFHKGMYRNTVEVNDALLDLENALLTLGEHSIPEAMKKFHSAHYQFSALVNTFNYVDELIKEEAKKQQSSSQEGQTAAPPAQPGVQHHIGFDDSVASIARALHVLVNIAGVNISSIQRIYTMLKEHRDEEDPTTKSLFADTIKEQYDALIDESMEAIEAKYGPIDAHNPQVLVNEFNNDATPSGGTAQAPASQPTTQTQSPPVNVNPTPDVAIPKSNQAEKEEEHQYAEEPKLTMGSFSSSEYLVKTAHNILTRFLRRQVVKATPFNKTAPLRLKAADVVEECKKEVKKLMQTLKGKGEINPAEIGKILIEITSKFEEIGKVLRILGLIHKRDVYNASGKKKDRGTNSWDDPLSENIFKQKIKKDLSRGLH